MGTVNSKEQNKTNIPVVTDDKAREVVSEVLSGLYRLDIGGPFKPRGRKETIEVIYARRPTQADLIYFRDAELKMKNRLAREVDEDGNRAWYWQAEIEKDLESRGLWAKEDRDELEKYQNETIRILLNIKNATTEAERDELKRKYEEAKINWVSKISKLYAYLDSSIEVQAKARSQLYRMQRLIVFVNDKGELENVWSTIEDIYNEEQMPLFRKITEEFTRIERGYEEDFLG